MKQMIEQADVIFFDMDGTLYEGTAHYDIYAEQIGQELPASLRTQFMADYRRAMLQKSPLRPGTIYLKEPRWIASVDPFTMQTLAIHSWDGEPIPQQTNIQHLAPDAYIAIGDPWWIPYTCAVHLGADPTFAAYERTKEMMMDATYPFARTKNLKENLTQLKQTKTLICITNSYSEDARGVLERLGIQDLFAHLVAPGNKPREIKQHFAYYMKLYDAAPKTALSVGDNIFNEIVPALEMGIPAVLLSAWGESYQHPHLKIIPTLANML